MKVSETRRQKRRPRKPKTAKPLPPRKTKAHFFSACASISRPRFLEAPGSTWTKVRLKWQDSWKSKKILKKNWQSQATSRATMVGIRFRVVDSRWNKPNCPLREEVRSIPAWISSPATRSLNTRLIWWSAATRANRPSPCAATLRWSRRKSSLCCCSAKRRPI